MITDTAQNYCGPAVATAAAAASASFAAAGCVASDSTSLSVDAAATAPGVDGNIYASPCLLLLLLLWLNDV